MQSTSLTNVYTVVTGREKKNSHHLFQSLSCLCYFDQIKYVKIKRKSEGTTTMFDFLDTGTYSDLIRLIALACWGLKQILFYLTFTNLMLP